MSCHTRGGSETRPNPRLEPMWYTAPLLLGRKASEVDKTQRYWLWVLLTKMLFWKRFGLQLLPLVVSALPGNNS